MDIPISFAFGKGRSGRGATCTDSLRALYAQHYLDLRTTDRILELDPATIDYLPTRGERVLGHAKLDENSGRLVLTDKALVIETQTKNERVTFGRISKIEMYSNGIVVRKRNGAPKQYLIKDNPDFLALASSVLHLV